MPSRSCFPCITLVESLADNCIPVLRDCVGKYTHIQSFNGILLDGLGISDVTRIIKTSAQMSYVQLTVRHAFPQTLEDIGSDVGSQVGAQTEISGATTAPSLLAPSRPTLDSGSASSVVSQQTRSSASFLAPSRLTLDSGYVSSIASQKTRSDASKHSTDGGAPPSTDYGKLPLFLSYTHLL